MYWSRYVKAQNDLSLAFDELLTKAERGDHRNVDVLVSDIPLATKDKLRLPADLIAGSFGKCVDRK